MIMTEKPITLKLLDSCDGDYAVFYRETLEGEIPVCGRDCQITIRHHDDGSKEISWDFLDEEPGDEMTTIPSHLLDDLMAAALAVSQDVDGAGGRWLERSNGAIDDYLNAPAAPIEDVKSRPCEVGDCRVIFKFASDISYSLVSRGYCANCQSFLGKGWSMDTNIGSLDISDHLKEQRP